MYLKVAAVDDKGEFQPAAPEGTDVDVVVCVPFPHTKSTVSPTFALTVLGENDVPPTLIMCIVELEDGGGLILVL